MKAGWSLRLVAAAALVASAVGSPARAYHDSPAQQVLYHDGLQQQAPITESHHDDHDHDEHWWTPLVSSSKERISSLVDESADYLSSGFEKVVDAAENVQDKFRTYLDEAVDQGNLGIKGGHHDFPDKTIYDLISLSNYTTKFHKLVSEYPDIVETLNSTKANFTLFVPIDEAFDNIPEHHKHDKKPSKEFIESLLKYHIGLGEYRAKTILTTHTLPTALDEKFLGGEPQRLRTSVGLSGVRVNFYSRVVATDIGAKNGVIHGVRSILVPPPFAGRLISLFPGEFSTLLLAFEKTEFGKYIHSVKTEGSTIFAPSNNAFAWLGLKANAFLFNTETGLKYLKAILKYHIAPNATLYSDAFYDQSSEGVNVFAREHYDLKTLLDDAHVSVDIASLGAFTSIRVNGFSHVSISDGIAKNGAIQVIDKVLLPPHKKHGHHEADNFIDGGEIEIEDLIERLAEYVE
jgi:uncharacterized surface protein with fasciclin (FAS1) repeats